MINQYESPSGLNRKEIFLLALTLGVSLSCPAHTSPEPLGSYDTPSYQSETPWIHMTLPHTSPSTLIIYLHKKRNPSPDSC